MHIDVFDNIIYISYYDLPFKERRKIRKIVKGLKSNETTWKWFLRYEFTLPYVLNGKKVVVYGILGDRFKWKDFKKEVK